MKTGINMPFKSKHHQALSVLNQPNAKKNWSINQLSLQTKQFARFCNNLISDINTHPKVSNSPGGTFCACCTAHRWLQLCSSPPSFSAVSCNALMPAHVLHTHTHARAHTHTLVNRWWYFMLLYKIHEHVLCTQHTSYYWSFFYLFNSQVQINLSYTGTKKGVSVSGFPSFFVFLFSCCPYQIQSMTLTDYQHTLMKWHGFQTYYQPVSELGTTQH